MTDELKLASPLPLPLKAVGGEIYGKESFLVARVTAGPGGASVNSEHDRVKARAREIVAACNAYPELRARVAALEAENARLRSNKSSDKLTQRVLDDLAELKEYGLLEVFMEANSDLVARLRAALAPKVSP